VTVPLIDRGSATAIAEDIRAAIHAETGLTASAGVACNKFLAKLSRDSRLGQRNHHALTVEVFNG